jgi:hypothetical protein
MHKEREEETREKRRENQKRTRRRRERWKAGLSLGHCGVRRRGERAGVKVAAMGFCRELSPAARCSALGLGHAAGY